MNPWLFLFLISGYFFFLAIYAFGPILLLLKRISDAAGGQKKLFWKYVFLFLGGALATAPILLCEIGLTEIFDPDPKTIRGAFIDAFVVAGFVEETFKFIVLMLFVLTTSRFIRYVRGISFAAFVSMGFAFVENIFYIVQHDLPNHHLITAITRALTSIPGHFSFAVLMGYFLSLAVLGKNKGVNILKTKGAFAEASASRKWNFFKYLALSYLSAVGAHGVYDFLLMVGRADADLGGLGFVAWIGYMVFVYKGTVMLCDQLKAKDDKLREKNAPKKDYYRIASSRARSPMR
ncbi:MAG: PrsW family intramembrane metalloprotease [Thermoguttaceae bacterium]|nr:PrsW family intramembrane metalloprotease [Thermoguttaceae bacterium]